MDFHDACLSTLTRTFHITWALPQTFTKPHMLYTGGQTLKELSKGNSDATGFVSAAFFMNKPQPWVEGHSFVTLTAGKGPVSPLYT